MTDKPSPIDQLFLLEMTGDDVELANDMLAFFLTNAENYLEALETMKESPDEWRLMAHKFKGACRSIGAKGLADVLQLAEPIEPSDQLKRQEFLEEISVALKNISLVKV